LWRTSGGFPSAAVALSGAELTPGLIADSFYGGTAYFGPVGGLLPSLRQLIAKCWLISGDLKIRRHRQCSPYVLEDLAMTVYLPLVACSWPVEVRQNSLVRFPAIAAVFLVLVVAVRYRSH